MSVQRRQTDAGIRYIVRWRDPSGQPRSRTYTRKFEADRYDHKVQADIDAGTYIDPNAGRIPLKEWADRWFATKATLSASSHSAYKSGLVHVLDRIGTRHLSTLKPSDIRTVVAAMVNAGMSRSRIETAMSPLRQMLTAAVDDGLILKSPMPKKIDLPRQETRDLTVPDYDDIDRLADTRSPRDRLLIRFLAYTGLRWGEATALTVADVDLLRREVRVFKSLDRYGNVNPTKTGERRTVPLNTLLHAELSGWMAGRPADAVLFPTSAGGNLSQSTWRRNVWLPALKAAGLSGLRVHDLRHTAATHLVNVTDLKSAMEILGHTKADTTLRYLHSNEDSKRAAVEALTGRRGIGYATVTDIKEAQ